MKKKMTASGSYQKEETQKTGQPGSCDDSVAEECAEVDQKAKVKTDGLREKAKETAGRRAKMAKVKTKVKEKVMESGGQHRQER